MVPTCRRSGRRQERSSTGWRWVPGQYQIFDGYLQGRSNIPLEVCKCMKNIESNGILKMLRLIALKVRNINKRFHHTWLCLCRWGSQAWCMDSMWWWTMVPWTGVVTCTPTILLILMIRWLWFVFVVLSCICVSGAGWSSQTIATPENRGRLGCVEDTDGQHEERHGGVQQVPGHLHALCFG